MMLTLKFMSGATPTSLLMISKSTAGTFSFRCCLTDKKSQYKTKLRQVLFTGGVSDPRMI